MSQEWGRGDNAALRSLSHSVITLSRTIHMWSNTSSIDHYQYHYVISEITLDIMREDGKVSEYLLITTHWLLLTTNLWSRHRPGLSQPDDVLQALCPRHSLSLHLVAWPPHPIHAIIYLTLDIAHREKMS